ncbi:nucleotide-diphospho-sugar transferase [Chitinophaga agrisoli]|uniref:Nucleotide-diphospho-sugar transferase n=1 Tax=Chitinophaga agrisoli TaxID=2607653 RepID=A0A5B2VVI0_9BACT|nr:nucleotide-diphospho-sugar transferase [Chitinophaga agrisoli]KAA2242568.1 nucleotide-diphospho-sugar transferase [Chitinophaga agrisoli]
MTNHTVQSPVLFIVFRRPDTTQQVFDQIRAARPARLYIAADGPREGNTADVEGCRQTREIVSKVDWDCEVKHLFFEQNQGCKMAVSQAISWFFEQEEEGIILEDDCLPSNSFFYFCDTLLAKYRHDSRIRNITGTNSQDGKQWGDASYYFSQHSNIWGWASWRRAWKNYDRELALYNDADAEAWLRKMFPDPFLFAAWLQIFRDTKAGKVDTWDYQFQLQTFFNNGLCAVPNVNLITNIGFGNNATHTFDVNHNANVPAGNMAQPLLHPVYFIPEKEADYFFFRKEYDLDAKWRRYNKPKRRFKRWVQGLFK